MQTNWQFGALAAVVIGIAINSIGCTRFKDAYRVDDVVGFSYVSCPKPVDLQSPVTSKPTKSNKPKRKKSDYSYIDLCSVHLAGTSTTKSAYEQIAQCQYEVLPSAPVGNGNAPPLNPDFCRLMRNSLQDYILSHSDKICAKHQAYIVANAAAWNVGFGFGANLLSGVASVAGAGTTKAALAGAAALSGGTRDLVNSEVYQKIFASAIVKASDTERLKRKTDILQKQTKAVTEYPVDMAIDDAQGYNTACSFASGIELVSQAVQRDSTSYNTLLSQQVDQLNTQIKAAEAILENKATSDTLRKLTEAQLAKLTAQRDVLQQQINPALAASGGTTSPPAASPISVTPSAVSIGLGNTQQFSVALSGATDTSVTWQVNGTPGGNSSVGTISVKGVYTAPTAVPASPVVTVSVLLASDSTKIASAQVTLVAPTTMVVSVTPQSANVKAGGTQQFSASVVNGAPSTVKWQINDVVGGSASIGTIDTKGMYKAPASVPNPATVTIKAISDADSTKSSSAIVTITK
jgi:hypothetical protein